MVYDCCILGSVHHTNTITKTSFVPLYLAYHHRLLATRGKQQEIRLNPAGAVVNQISSCTVFLTLSLSLVSLSSYTIIFSYHAHKHIYTYGAFGDIHLKNIVNRFVSYQTECRWYQIHTIIYT
jgi:hypothetical protein